MHRVGFYYMTQTRVLSNKYLQCTLSLQYNVNTGFLETLTARHLKTLPVRNKKLTAYKSQLPTECKYLFIWIDMFRVIRPSSGANRISFTNRISYLKPNST